MVSELLSQVNKQCGERRGLWKSQSTKTTTIEFETAEAGPPKQEHDNQNNIENNSIY